MFTLAALLLTLPSTSRAQVQEESAGARPLLHSAFDDLVQSMQQRFAKEDHAMLVGRKFSVDWSLTPALLMCEIIAGAPPEHWCRVLDDGYGESSELPTDVESVPPEVARGCSFLLSHANELQFEYLAERAYGTGAEVPSAIEWRCLLDGEAVRMRTMWYEPQVSLRGSDFPLPADRTLLEWNDRTMRVRVIGESVDWQVEWPTAGPLFDHVGDAYDLFDTLRAWHWAKRSPSDACARRAPATQTHDDGAVHRRARWSRENASTWTLSMLLRPAEAIRRAGFVVHVDGDASETLPRARPDARVSIVAENTLLKIVFTAHEPPCDTSTRASTRGVFLPSRISLHLAGEEIAYATIRAITIGDPSDRASPDPLAPTGAWSDAIMRIRLAQESPATPAAFPTTLLSRRWPEGVVRARLAANAWIFALRGDIPSLMETLTTAQIIRQRDGLAHHHLAALATIAESINIANGSDAVINAIAVRHAFAATELSDEALAPACLAATGSGRFWAALNIARAALMRCESESPLASQWKTVEAHLVRWRDEPALHIAFGADPAVLLLGERMNRDHIVRPESSQGDAPPQGTIDGRAAGAAYEVLEQTLQPLPTQGAAESPPGAPAAIHARNNAISAAETRSPSGGMAFSSSAGSSMFVMRRLASGSPGFTTHSPARSAVMRARSSSRTPPFFFPFPWHS